MLERAQEAQILADYEKALADATGRLADAQQEVESLRNVVQTIRRRLAETAAGSTKFPPADDLPTYRGQPSMRAYLIRLLQQEARIDVDQLVATVQADPHYSSNPPSRGTILARANDLVQRGRVIKPTDNEYALASPNGGDPAPGRTRSDREAARS
jgi:hypothetical protein